jgi:hypothetical protein
MVCDGPLGFVKDFDTPFHQGNEGVEARIAGPEDIPFSTRRPRKYSSAASRQWVRMTLTAAS